MSELLSSFNDRIYNTLGFKLRKYQEYVTNEVIKTLERGSRFIIVSMPTGSGKTLIEIFMAYYSLQRGIHRILVLEPTRFLCDQMYSGKDRKGGLWSRVFGDLVGKEYEGNCSSFLESGKRIIISTPQTALKCISTLREEFEVVIIDEVHHAFGGKYYTELLMELKPKIIIGFTALLPSYKKYRLDPKVKNVVGKPYLLSYDFKKLEEIDPEFNPPKAVADMFDAEMSIHENRVYNILFRALFQGDPKIIKFLELTLARYGKEAFCESYKRALERNKILPHRDLDELCGSSEPSHKARILADILTVYNIKENDELRPVLVFTSRKATAYEFRKTITSHIGFSDNEVAVLTSDMEKEERLELVKKAKNGEISIIISTLVGEEGVDIPEAGLLVMMDIPKSPLRFYQRLGRLIRMSSPQKMKYLAISLTPKTVEYWDLEDALWNLYSEGVDVSYIVVNLTGKTSSSRVLDILNEFSRIRSDTAIPYSLLAFGWELSNPLTYITKSIMCREDLKEAVRDHMKKWGLKADTDEDLEYGIYLLLTFPMFKWGMTKDIFKPLDNAVNKSSFSKEFSRAIREKKIFYIYDVGMLSEIVGYQLQILYRSCISGHGCSDEFFRIARKSILRLFTRAFPYSSINDIIRKLKEERLEIHKRFLEEAKQNGILKDYSIWIDWGDYNERSKFYSPKIIIGLGLENVWIYQYAQINYYDISKDIHKDENIKELIKTNLLTIGYEASKKFLEQLYEFNE